MQKIYLINLPSEWMVNSKIHMPLGLMFLHEYLTVNGIEVPPIVDLAGLPEKKWNIPDDGEYYGISSTTPQYPYAVKVAEKIKEQNPQAKTILGGIHATAVPKQCSGEEFNIVVENEGEELLLQLIQKPARFITGLPPYSSDIDRFPHPKLDCISGYTLRQTYAFQDQVSERDAGWLLTSRGCNQNCSFCASRCMWQGKVRFHSIAYLQEWVEYWLHMGINNFHFVDEQIAYNEKRLTEICELMKHTKGYWKCLVRGDSINPHRAKMMYESGCRQIIIGIESGSQRLLDLCNKKESVYDNEQAIMIAHDAGIGVKASLMVGLPTETQEDIDKTAELLEKTKPEEAGIFIFVPHPGSPIFHNPEQYGYKMKKDVGWEDYVCIGKDYFTPVLEEGKEEIVKERKFQLMKVAGKSYILDAQKHRWEKWKTS